MTPTKILIGQIIVVFAVVIGAVWGATQWTAVTLGHDPWLGAPWKTVARNQNLSSMALVPMVVRL